MVSVTVTVWLSGARFWSPPAKRSSRAWSQASLSESLLNATLRPFTRNLAPVTVAVAEDEVAEDKANALMDPTVGVILATRSKIGRWKGTKQLAVRVWVVFRTETVGTTKSMVKRFLVEVVVTAAG